MSPLSQRRTMRDMRLRLPRQMMLILTAMLVGSAMVGCGSANDAVVDSTTEAITRTVHVSGVACSEPREGVGVDLGDGWILTSGHVVDGLTEAIVIQSPGSQIPAEIVHIDRRLDLAILAVDTFYEGVVVIDDLATGESGTVHLRDPDGEVTSSVVTVERRIRAQTLDVGRREEIERPSLQLTATLARGDSGAALWDDQGQVVGVLWAISTSVDSRAFAVQGDELAAALRDAEENPSGLAPC